MPYKTKELQKAWETKNTHRRAAYQRKRMYGVTNEDYLALLKAQNGKCKICHKEAKLVIDHDHLTNKVRGLLCDTCNRGIGFLKEDLEILRSAIEYLR